MNWCILWQKTREQKQTPTHHLIGLIKRNSQRLSLSGILCLGLGWFLRRDILLPPGLKLLVWRAVWCDSDPLSQLAPLTWCIRTAGMLAQAQFAVDVYTSLYTKLCWSSVTGRQHIMGNIKAKIHIKVVFTGLSRGRLFVHTLEEELAGVHWACWRSKVLLPGHVILC